MTEPGARTARRRTIVGTGLVVALAAVLIAIVVVRSAGEKVLGGNADTLVLVGKDTDAAAKDALEGPLSDVGGCLGVSGTVVVWPHGTTIETPEPLRVTVDGVTSDVGDTVDLRGARGGPLTASSFFYDKVPAGCRGAEVFVAVNR